MMPLPTIRQIVPPKGTGFNVRHKTITSKVVLIPLMWIPMLGDSSGFVISVGWCIRSKRSTSSWTTTGVPQSPSVCLNRCGVPDLSGSVSFTKVP